MTSVEHGRISLVNNLKVLKTFDRLFGNRQAVTDITHINIVSKRLLDQMVV